MDGFRTETRSYGAVCWDDVDEHVKFKAHLDKECLYDFIAEVSSTDEARGEFWEKKPVLSRKYGREEKLWNVMLDDNLLLSTRTLCISITFLWTSFTVYNKNIVSVLNTCNSLWIYQLKYLVITHPTQSCFMSSIDIHTHYSYQIMLPESIAIVMAPKDCSRNHGIFRLTSGGMTVIRECPRRGFHSHDPPSDGSSIYRHCTDVYMNSNLRFDVIDLR